MQLQAREGANTITTIQLCVVVEENYFIFHINSAYQASLAGALNSSLKEQRFHTTTKMRTQFTSALCLLLASPFLGCNAFQSSFSATATTKKVKRQQLDLSPMDFQDAIPSMLTAMDDEDMGNFGKSAAIVFVLGGGLIPALIGANSAMFKTLFSNSNRKEEDPEELAKIAKSGDTFDPTLTETKFRQYVEDSGATGPELPLSGLLFAPEKIPVADIVAILGRIADVNSIADWKNLPSTKMPGVSSNPPMWLPRDAFKVYIRKAKFLGWPTDPKTGLPVGGEELKNAELQRVSKQGALISDAALDAVFDTWAWGAGVATPDKVAKTLKVFQPSSDQVNLGDFVGAAIRGRSATGFAALFFITLQIVALGALFIGPTLRVLFDIDIGFGQLGG